MEIGYGFKPFWFWNGDMDDNEIIRQIQEMHDKGVDGFFIHPRQGLTVPYLSEVWFEKIGVAVKTAKELSMEVWLYDEYTYPSGAAGGRIMIERPELKARTLEIFTNDVSGGNVSIDYKWGKVISACACPLNDGTVDWAGRVDLSAYIGSIYPGMAYQDSGLTFYNKKRFFSEGCMWNLTWNAPEGSWRVYVSIEYEMTGFKYFGTFIDPVNPEAVRLFIEFTHEKYKEHFAEEFGKTIKGIFADETTPWGYEGQRPWSPILPELFKKANGYDLCGLLPALVDDIGEDTERIRRDYFQTVTDAFIENFDGQISRWCKENNILFTGEKPILRCSHLKYSGIPGIDAGHQKAGDMIPIGGKAYRQMPKIAASAAHFYGNGLALVEAFHSMGWDVTLQDLKYNIDIFNICGVNVFTPHAFFYSTDGMRKHDAPPSCFFQMPAWKHMGLLSDHVKKTGAFLQGVRKADILLLDQSTGFWTLGGRDREKKAEYRKVFSDLQEKLMFNFMDFYIIDTELLSESCIEDKNIIVNGEAFKVLVIPPMDYIDEATATFINNFEQAGGSVIRADISAGADDAVEHAKPYAKPYAEFKPCAPEGAGKILACVFEKDDKYKIFALNTAGYAVEAELIAGGSSKRVDFKPFESKFIEYGNSCITLLDDDNKPTKTVELPIGNEWEMSIQNKNVIGIREWTLTLPDGQSALVGSKPVINQFVDAGFKFAPKYSQGFGTAPRMRFPETVCSYSAEFYADEVTNMFLVMEPDGILGEYTIELNGHELQKSAFTKTRLYSDTNLSADIGSYVRQGGNILVIRVDIKESWHGIVNPLYIFGDFGVIGNKTVKLPETGVPFKYVDSLLPYYAGEVCYKTTMGIDAGGCEDIILTLPDNMGLEISLAVNGHEMGGRCYSPYEWRVPAGAAGRAGGDEIIITACTGMSPLFEGEAVDPVSHEIRKI